MRPLQRWLTPLGLAALFVGLAWAGWRAWMDALVDFGHELYIPWRLAGGEVLYRDIAHLYGPLSQYLNAGIFAAAGPGVTALLWVNLALLAGVTAAAVVLVRPLGELAAAACGATLLALFGFAHLTGIGNYSFAAPYSHEATHGIALAALALVALAAWARREGAVGVRWAGLAGLAAGAALLTRAEVAVAVSAAAGAGAVLATAGGRRGLGAFAAGYLAPPLLALAAFATALPAGDAARAAGGAFAALLGSDVASGGFFAQGMGLDDPAGNAAALLRVAGWQLAWLGAALAVDRLTAARGRAGLVVVAVLALAQAYALTSGWVRWSSAARPLPLYLGLGLVGVAVAAWRRRAEPEALRALVVPAAAVTLGLALLGKMILNARVPHYGFYLAMPASLVVVAALVGWLPERLVGAWGGGWGLRLLALSAALAACVVHARVSQGNLDKKTAIVGQGADAMRTYPAAVDPDRAALGDVVGWLGANTRPEEAVAVLPEGIMINYLSRRRNPTPYLSHLPTELAAFGQPAMDQALVEAAPEVVVVFHRDATEWGLPPFGEDPRFGAALMGWLRGGYQPAACLGEDASLPLGCRALIARRNP